MACIISECDAIEEFLACGIYPPAADFSFGEVAEALIAVSKVMAPLLDFRIVRVDGGDHAQFLAKVELEAERIVGSYDPREHEACIKLLPNGSYLNQAFEKAGVAYAVRLAPDTEASIEASKRRKVMPMGKLLQNRLELLQKIKLPGYKLGKKFSKISPKYQKYRLFW
jgi:hypothetical protein